MELIFKKAQKQFTQKLPLVIYKKPNETLITALFQKNDSLFEVADFSEKGFVFASFDGSKTVLIPENESELLESKINEKEVVTSGSSFDLPNQKEKDSFIHLVATGIQAIGNQEFQKVVLSRKETLDLGDFQLIETFRKLVQLYPTTFVYCFYHPKVGTWMGATPEQLLQSNETLFNTIALAGTQKDADSTEVFWENKEKEEQQFVTDYIVNTLNNVASDVRVSNPYSIKAGSIWHIKTDISGTLNSECTLREVIELLHPTPAICGLPKDKSKAFILENENYHRTFYTGFLGELNRSTANNSKRSDLFVNLRCMEIEGQKANLFMGCGITKDSIPNKEWEESVNKSATMKKVLDCRK